VRLVSGSARVDDLVRVTVAGVEVEGRIEAVESSTARACRPSSVLAVAAHRLHWTVSPLFGISRFHNDMQNSGGPGVAE
jgi:hypothetical protein